MAERINTYMGAADMNIVNVIDMPNQVPPVMDELTAQPNIDAVFYYAYDDYSQLAGNITWSNGKPIIGSVNVQSMSRFNHNYCRQRAGQSVDWIQHAGTDRTDAHPAEPQRVFGRGLQSNSRECMVGKVVKCALTSQYPSVRSMNVSAVVDCVKMAQGLGGVRVVAPDDFVRLLVENVVPEEGV